MLGLNLALRSNNLPPFDPRRLFRNGEQGVWYDPSDLSTLFQNSAGTIPVTGVEQPVGLMLDKSGRGKHASQPTTTARPILSARYNILTDTSFTSTAQWGMGSWVFSGGETDPFGGTAAAKVQMGGGTAQAPARIIGPVAGDVVFRVWWKAGNQLPVFLTVRNDTTATILGTVRCDTGAVTGTVTGSIIQQQNGFNLVELRTVGFPPGNTLRIYLGGTGGVPEGTHSFWYGPDLRLVCDADEGPMYQYVAPAAASYEVAGFSRYLRFDGVDDHLNIGVLNMSAASAAGYFSAMTKLSDASSACWYSHGLTTAVGSVRLLAPANNGQASVRAGFYSTSGLREVGGTDHAAPITLTVKSEIAPGVGMWITHNNAARLQTAVDPTVFSAGEACIGAQVFNGSRGNFFNGRIYALLVAGRKYSGSEHAAIEAYLRRKSRAY